MLCNLDVFLFWLVCSGQKLRVIIWVLLYAVLSYRHPPLVYLQVHIYETLWKFDAVYLYIYIYYILHIFATLNDHQWSWMIMKDDPGNPHEHRYIYIHIFICLFRKIDRIIWWAQARPGYLGIEDWPWWNGASVGHIFCPLQPSATKQATERHRKKMDGFKHLGCWCFILLRLMIRLDW